MTCSPKVIENRASTVLASSGYLRSSFESITNPYWVANGSRNFGSQRMKKFFINLMIAARVRRCRWLDKRPRMDCHRMTSSSIQAWVASEQVRTRSPIFSKNKQRNSTSQFSAGDLFSFWTISSIGSAWSAMIGLVSKTDASLKKLSYRILDWKVKH